MYTDHRALKWLLNLKDPSYRLTHWAMKLPEYDFVVEHRPNTRMRHADALSRCINVVGQNLTLARDTIKVEQEQDALCQQYRQQEAFWVDEDGLLYWHDTARQLRVVIPTSLVPVVLRNYHELPFTAHQEIGRTIEFIKRKYWWETLATDVREYIKRYDACAKRKRETELPHLWAIS